jgi:hypothetical protein
LAVALCHEVTARVGAAGGHSVFINTGPRPEYPAPHAAYAQADFKGKPVFDVWGNIQGANVIR